MTDILDKPTVVELHRRIVVGARERVLVGKLPSFFARAIPAVQRELDRQGITAAGPPVAIYRNEVGQRFEVTAGFPVGLAPAPLPGGLLVVDDLPGGRAVCAEHVGPYETLPETYAALSEWFARQELTPPHMMWEEYLVGPGEAAATAYRTQIVYPLV